MIKGKCRTNLDDYDCSLVKVFAEIPRLGDSVYVSLKGKLTTLEVCQITHSTTHVGTTESQRSFPPNVAEPFIEVELTKKYQKYKYRL